MKSYDAVALGELLIDFTQNGRSAQGNDLFEANPGGAPGNVLSMLGRLGRRTAFIGKVGADRFGEQLRSALAEQHIDTSALRFDDAVPTTLAFVHKLPDGDRDFSFYRTPGADVMLTPQEVPESLLRDTKLFHFGTLSMTGEPVRSATQRALELAKAAGALISFDPNLRPPLWKREDDAREAFAYGMRHCDVLKISDNEIEWFTGCTDIDAGIGQIADRFGIPLILASLGAQGSRAYRGALRVEAPAFLNPATADTTGAGDTFCACCLHAVLEHGLEQLSEARLAQMLRFANAAASLVTTRKGALRVMPSRAEVDAFLEQHRTPAC